MWDSCQGEHDTSDTMHNIDMNITQRALPHFKTFRYPNVWMRNTVFFHKAYQEIISTSLTWLVICRPCVTRVDPLPMITPCFEVVVDPVPESGTVAGPDDPNAYWWLLVGVIGVPGQLNKSKFLLS